jgi:hypothetical protein
VGFDADEAEGVTRAFYSFDGEEMIDDTDGLGTAGDVKFTEKVTIPANTLKKGSGLKIRAGGVYSCSGSPDVRAIVWLNGSPLISERLAAETDADDAAWMVDVTFSCKSNTNAKAWSLGYFLLGGQGNIASTRKNDFFDPTVADEIEVSFRIWTANATNEAKLTIFTVEQT